MASILFKWFLVVPLCFLHIGGGGHPFYVSIVEIGHNKDEKTLEISCKIFTDDFEQTLRQAYKIPVDLLNPKDRKTMDKLVKDYVTRHLKIKANNMPKEMVYLGYEQVEEGIYSYFQVDNLENVINIEVTNNVLYEYKKEQVCILHVTVNGTRKSTKLVNPESQARFSF